MYFDSCSLLHVLDPDMIVELAENGVCFGESVEDFLVDHGILRDDAAKTSELFD